MQSLLLMMGRQEVQYKGSGSIVRRPASCKSFA